MKLDFSYVMQHLSESCDIQANRERDITAHAEHVASQYLNKMPLVPSIVRKQCIMVLDYA